MDIHQRLRYLFFSHSALSFSLSLFSLQFIDILEPPHIVLVHGEAHTMGRLHTALVSKFTVKKIQVYSPKNCEEVKLQFVSEKTAKAVGQIAARPPTDQQVLFFMYLFRVCMCV